MLPKSETPQTQICLYVSIFYIPFTGDFTARDVMLLATHNSAKGRFDLHERVPCWFGAGYYAGLLLRNLIKLS